jgi:hypothetical protein
MRSITKCAPFAVLVVTSCGGGIGDGAGPRRPLPAYSSHAAELFDDTIEPAAVGLTGLTGEPGKSPRGDPLLRERAQVGDATLHVRVVTVTLRHENAQQTWQVGFHTVETFAATHPPESDFTLQVDPTDPAAGFLRAFEARLIGMTFVAFVRQFAASDATESARWHFHLAHADKNEIDAVRAASALGKLR